MSIAELGENAISGPVTSILLVKTLCSGADLRTLEWEPGAAVWSEAGEAAQDSLQWRIPALPQPVGWSVLAGSGGEKTLVRDGASLGKGFGCLPSLALKLSLQLPDVRMGCGRRTRFPAIGLLLAELLLQPVCRLSSIRVKEGLAGEVFGSVPGLTRDPGTQFPGVCDLCSGIFQTCQDIV